MEGMDSLSYDESTARRIGKTSKFLVCWRGERWSTGFSRLKRNWLVHTATVQRSDLLAGVSRLDSSVYGSATVVRSLPVAL